MFAETTKLEVPARRVLVVDDNHDVADTLASALRLIGQTVVVAYSGASALLALEDFAAELMVLDLSMPEMDGFSLARAIRMRAQFDHVPLVALSGFGRESDRLAARAAGFDHHLTKPIEFDEIRRMVGAARNYLT